MSYEDMKCRIIVLLVAVVALKSICLVVNCMFPGVQAINELGSLYGSRLNPSQVGSAPITPAPTFYDIMRPYMTYPTTPVNVPPQSVY